MSKGILLITIIFLITSRSFAQESKTYIQKITGTGTANGGEYNYEATLQAKIFNSGFGGIAVKVGIKEYTITSYTYKGEYLHKSEEGFPISIKNIQSDLIDGFLNVKSATNHYSVASQKFSLLGVRQGSLDNVELTNENLKSIKNYNGGGEVSFDDFYLEFYGKLKNTYFEELSKHRTSIDRNNRQKESDNQLSDKSEANEQNFNSNRVEQNNNQTNTSTPVDKQKTMLQSTLSAYEQRINNYERACVKNVDIVYSEFSKIRPVQVDMQSIRSAANPVEALKSSKQVIEAYKKKIMQTNEAFYNSAISILQSSGSREEFETDLFSVGVVGVATLVSNAEAKKAQKEAELEKQKMFNKYGNELLNEYIKARFNSLDQAAWAEQLADEQLAFSYAKYYLCQEQELRRRFNYNDAGWFNLSNQCVIQEVNTQQIEIPRMATIDRKLRHFEELKYEPFRSAAINLLNKEVSTFNAPNALILRAKMSKGQLANQLADLYAAKEQLNSNFTEQELLTKLESEFNTKYYKAILDDNVIFLMEANQLNVYPTKSSNYLDMWPLAYSVSQNSNECFEYLAQNYPKFYENKKKDFYLMACKYNAVEILQYIEKSSKVKVQDYGSTPIEIAFHSQSIEVFSHLIEMGASFKKLPIQSNSDKQLLTRMIICSGLLNRNADLLNSGLSMEGVTDEMLVNIYQEYGISNPQAKSLLSAIRDKDILIEGKSLYRICMENDDPEVFQYLLSLNFNTSVQGEDKGIIESIIELHPSKICRDAQILGAINLNLLDKNGKALVHYCIDYSSLELMDLMLKRGWIDPNLKDGKGNTPLHRAIERGGDITTLLILCEYGANTKTPDANGYTAVEHAKSNRLKSQSKILKHR